MRRITKAAVRNRLSRAKAVVRAAQFEVEDRRRRRLPRSAVHFADWVDRRLDRGAAAFPDAWRIHPDLPFSDPSRVGVLIHVFYGELLGELLDSLAALPVEFDLIVTNASGAPVAVDASFTSLCKHAVVLDVANHGRDIWPMLQVVNAGLLDPYDIVLKLHTKRSAWREGHVELGGSGEQWRLDLLNGLVGDRARAEQVLASFAALPDLGVVTAPGNILGPEFWGADLASTQELLRRVELTVAPERLRFPAGSFYWVRGFVLQGLRSLSMSAEDFEPEQGHIDGTTAHAVERSIGILAEEAGLQLTTTADLEATSEGAWYRYARHQPRTPRARVVPFYLPQFHATPENDRWWGRGFTEWTNVSGARPVYLGHNQPNLPADLGFYDLRLDEVRQSQLELADAHGVEGFMYYYYWFAGQRLLNLPIDKLLDGTVQKPFCIMWANENWTRRWDGRSKDVLIGQDYDRVPAETFIEDVLHFLADPRYLRVDGKPVLSVYRIAQLPDYAAVIATWRRRAREAGIGEIMILAVDVMKEFDGLPDDPRTAGLDGKLGFPPHNLKWEWVPHGGLRVDKRFSGNILSYQAMADDAAKRLVSLDDGSFPGVMVAFDNTARRQWAPDLWYGANPYTFRRWLAAARSSVVHRPPQERVVFVNAWNEWAESAVLEPSRRFGRSYLLAVRDVVYG